MAGWAEDYSVDGGVAPSAAPPNVRLHCKPIVAAAKSVR